MNAPPRYTPDALNLETARIDWSELERHFARGVVIEVAPELDLVEVAAGFANDDKHAVEAWLDSGRVRRLPIETARCWSRGDAQLWAVVVAPWVLTQARSG